MAMICSGFSPTGRVQYGERFLRSIDEHLPRDIALGVWVEEPTGMPREAMRDLWAIEGAAEFRDRHAGNLDAHGKVPHRNWKATEVAKGYSFRHDAGKFWKQILIPQAAAAECQDGEILAWFDADVVFHRSIPPLESLIRDAELVFLGRDRQHSEIGFWAVRLNAKTREFLRRIAELYTSDAVFELDEWHSAYAWDHVRRQMGILSRNLCPPGVRGHVWPMTPLAKFCRHDKGPRKPR